MAFCRGPFGRQLLHFSLDCERFKTSVKGLGEARTELPMFPHFPSPYFPTHPTCGFSATSKDSSS